VEETHISEVPSNQRFPPLLSAGCDEGIVEERFLLTVRQGPEPASSLLGSRLRKWDFFKKHEQGFVEQLLPPRHRPYPEFSYGQSGTGGGELAAFYVERDPVGRGIAASEVYEQRRVEKDVSHYEGSA